VMGKWTLPVPAIKFARCRGPTLNASPCVECPASVAGFSAVAAVSAAALSGFAGSSACKFSENPGKQAIVKQKSKRRGQQGMRSLRNQQLRGVAVGYKRQIKTTP